MPISSASALPVLIKAFNRPECLESVLASLRQVDDLRVVVSIDGPRQGFPNDFKQVANSIALVRDSGLVGAGDVWAESMNLGCGTAMWSAIVRFFSMFPAGVVLEDDCVPTAEFLDHCRLWLRKLESHPFVGLLSGISYVPEEVRGSYGATPYLSIYPQIWGWASWANRIRGFSHRSPMRLGGLSKSPQWQALSALEKFDWARSFRRSRAVAWRDNWDVQFVYHMWSLGLFSVAPPIPLIRNIGFGESATHTDGPAPSWYRNPPPPEVRASVMQGVSEVSPGMLRRDLIADRWTAAHIYSPSLADRLSRRLP